MQNVTATDRIVSWLLRLSKLQTGHRVLDIGNNLRPRPPAVGIPRTGVKEGKTTRQHYAPRCDAMQSVVVLSVVDHYCLIVLCDWPWPLVTKWTGVRQTGVYVAHTFIRIVVWFLPEAVFHLSSSYSDTSANEDNTFRNHIR